ncbi:MAG: AAA family ATPase [Defluviitaleaceae bacterium]|nr:AAA family ATPase [Defluviitaleaceae bacterium]
MKLVVIIGAGAVGKMTVGQELAKITDLRLMHNHMTIELCLEVFGKRVHGVVDRIRHIIFEEFAKSTDQYGMIFTWMWAFNLESDWDYIRRLVKFFEDENGEIYWVELVADQKTRLARNVTENRLTHKASKRDTEWSNNNILNEDEGFRLVSHDGEIPYENYIKIDNTNLPADAVANMIKERFSL